MKDWELIERPTGVVILRFSDQYLLNNGKRLFWALAEGFREEEFLDDVVSGSNEIAFFIKPHSEFRIDEKLVIQKINELNSQESKVRHHKLEFQFNGEDLNYCIELSKLSKEEWIEKFLSIEFSVGLIGFIPYFSYLEGLPMELNVPRRLVARTKVRKGSLAIGAGYVGVYPQESPGGWNLIGECLELDKLKDFRLGDKVNFIVKRGINAGN